MCVNKSLRNGSSIRGKGRIGHNIICIRREIGLCIGYTAGYTFAYPVACGFQSHYINCRFSKTTFNFSI